MRALPAHLRACAPLFIELQNAGAFAIQNLDQQTIQAKDVVGNDGARWVRPMKTTPDVVTQLETVIDEINTKYPRFLLRRCE